MSVTAEQRDKSMHVSALHPDKALTSVTATHQLMHNEVKELHEAAREVMSTMPLHPEISSDTRRGQEAKQLMSTMPGLLRVLSAVSDEHAASELISCRPGQLLMSRDVRERHAPSATMLAKS